MSLKREILSLIFLLTLLTILAMSAAYYFLFTRQIQEHSRSQVNMAFELVFDDLNTRAHSVASKFENFINSSLSGPMYVIQLLEDQYNQSQEAWAPRDVGKILTRLSTIANEINTFGDLIDAMELMVYDKEKNLLAVSYYQGDGRLVGVYLPKVFENALIPMKPEDDWFTFLRSLDEIPQQPLPDDLKTMYPDEIPNELAVELTAFKEMLAMKFSAPIVQKGEQGGFCVVYVDLRQDDVERYSRLSQTRVNLFAGKTFSVGTLAEYSVMPQDQAESRQPVDVFNMQEQPSIAFSEVSVSGQRYYQGSVLLGNKQALLGAIIAYFPLALEEAQRKEFFVLVAMITLIFGILTAGGASLLSAIIVRPIIRLTQLLQQLTQGDLASITEESSQRIKLFEEEAHGVLRKQSQFGYSQKSEVGRLFQAFRSMIQYLREMAMVADRISRGEITQKVTPRSDRDVLGNAFHQMTQYLREIGEIAGHVARGDLRREITRKSESDQLGGALIHMQAGLTELISNIRSGEDYIDSISSQVLDTSSQNIEALEHIGHTADVTSAAMREMNASAEEARMNTARLASAVEQTSASITQMISSIKHVADNSRKLSVFADETKATVINILESLEKVAEQAEHSKTLAEKTTQDAISGQTSVEEMINRINSISDITMKNISDIILRLESRSVEIGRMLDVISDVAEQTNLLSLNASIIAAQAGTQGRGFAVVADEIKELATRTSSSSKEITKIIKAVQQDSSDAVTAIGQGQEDVKAGVSVAYKAGEALSQIRQSAGNSSQVAAEMAISVHQQTTAHTHIVESIRDVTSMINEITRATQEQEKNSSQLFSVVENMQTMASQVLRATQEQQKSTQHVTKFMEEVLTLVEKNTKTVEQLAQSSKELASQSELLKKQVERFIIPTD